MLLRAALDMVERRAALIGVAPWYQRLNPPRWAALQQLADEVGVEHLPAKGLAALRDERFEHAAEVFRVELGERLPVTWPRISRQIQTGQWQRLPATADPDLAGSTGVD